MSKSDDSIGVFDQAGHVRRGDPLAAHAGELILGRPPGDGAALSDVDRNGVFTGLAQEFPRWWHPDAFHPLDHVGKNELGGVAREDHPDLVADLDRAVDRQMQRDRSSSRVRRSTGSQVENPHDQSVCPRAPRMRLTTIPNPAW